jgi:hypothetical protein
MNYTSSRLSLARKKRKHLTSSTASSAVMQERNAVSKGPEVPCGRAAGGNTSRRRRRDRRRHLLAETLKSREQIAKRDRKVRALLHKCVGGPTISLSRGATLMFKSSKIHEKSSSRMARRSQTTRKSLWDGWKVKDLSSRDASWDPVVDSSLGVVREFLGPNVTKHIRHGIAALEPGWRDACENVLRERRFGLLAPGGRQLVVSIIKELKYWGPDEQPPHPWMAGRRAGSGFGFLPEAKIISISSPDDALKSSDTRRFSALLGLSKPASSFRLPVTSFLSEPGDSGPLAASLSPEGSREVVGGWWDA